MGSAAVFLALVNAVLIWACCLGSAYGATLLAWLS
jgi:diacylglycerol kinase